MSQRKATPRVLLSIGALQVLAMVVALVRAKALSLLLGPAGFGVASTIDQTVATLVSLGALSLPFTAMKFMARAHSEGEAPFRRTYASFLRVLAGLSAATVAVALAVVAAWPSVLGGDLAPYRVPLALGVLGVPAAMLAILFVNTLAAAQAPSASALVGVAAAAGLAVGGVVGQAVGGLPGLYVGVLIAGAVNTLGALAFLRRRLGLAVTERAGGLLAELRRSPEIATYSALLYAAMAAYALTMLATRYVVLARLGAAPAGLLQALLSLALTVGAVMTPMSNLVLTPLVNRRLSAEQKVAAANDFAGTMAVLLLLAALPMTLFPRLVLHALYSSQFAPAAAFLGAFVVWQCLYQLTNVYLQLLIGLDDVAWFAVATCASYAGVAALLPPLIARLGLSGVAGALAVGMAGLAVAAAYRLRTRFGCRVSGAVAGRSAFVLGALLVAGRAFADGRSERTALGAGLRGGYAAVVVGVLWALLGPEERAVATGVAGRLLGGVRARWGARRRAGAGAV